LDSTNPPRVARDNRELNLLGEFTGSVAATQDFPILRECTVRVFTEDLEIPEMGFKLRYEQVNDITAGSLGEIRGVLEELDSGQRIILIEFKGADSDKKLALTWAGDGINSIEYCEIMLYRAFAAHKVRSKNGGAPSYGIVGY
jgi:hypothetical protein